MKRRVLSALLALCLMVSLAPEAWASGGTPNSCGKNVEWSISKSGVLTIWATDPDNEMTSAPWSSSETITSVNIGENVTNIVAGAFSSRDELTTATIPASVKSIGSGAFAGCNNLEIVNYAGTADQWDQITGVEISGIKKSAVRPAETKPEPTLPDGYCGENMTWTVNDDYGILTISGKGRMKNYSVDDPAPWYPNRGSIKAVVIDAEIENIGDYALNSCGNVTDIYFLGSMEQWRKISTGAGNKSIIDKAIIHYGNSPCIVSFDPSISGATKTMPIVIVEATRPYVLPDDDFGTVAGKVFRGWRVNEGSDVYPKGYSYIITGDTTLRAFWVDDPDTSETYKISYRGITPAIPNGSYKTCDQNQVLLLATPKQIGYDLTSWTYTLPGGKQTTTPKDEPIILPANTKGDLIFTANWSPINYHITILDTDGTTELAQATYNYQEKVQTVSVTISQTKPGYTLKGVEGVKPKDPDDNELDEITSTRFGTSFQLSLPAKCIGNYDLKVQWEADSYQIIYDLDEGSVTGTVTNDTYTADQTEAPISLTNAPTPTKGGYEFAGWSCSVEGGVVSDDLKSLKLPDGTTGDVTLTAIWRPEVYTVAYKSDEAGTGTMEPGEATRDQPFELPKNGFTPPKNKKFGGWLIEGDVYDEKGGIIYILDKDGELTATKKTIFQPGDICYFRADTTVKAIWNEIVEITVQPNYGTEDIEKNEALKDIKDQKWTVTLNEPFTVPSANPFPVPEGKAFRGFYVGKNVATDTDGKTVTMLKPGDVCIFIGHPASDIVKASWENVYKVTYKPGTGATGEDVEKTIGEMSEGKGYKLPKIEEFAFTAPEGKSFAKWRIEVKGTDPVDKQPGETYDITSDVTITALWEAKAYKVIYDPGEGGTGTMTDDKSYEFNDSVTLPQCTFTAPTGKMFSHWDVEGYTGIEFNPGDTFKISKEETTVTAIWEDAILKVTFAPGSGSGVMEPESVKYGDNYKLPDYEFDPPAAVPADPDDPESKKDPYIFVGWKINDKIFDVGVTIEKVTTDITATAVWALESTLKSFTISFKPGIGTGEMEPQKFYLQTGETTKTVALPSTSSFVPPEPTMTLAGWMVGNTEVAPGGQWNLVSDVEATALWKGNIEYRGMEGCDTKEPDFYTYSDSQQILDLNIPTKPGGYVFEGWSCENEAVKFSDDNRRVILPAEFKGTLTITAKWADDEGKYRITFDPNGGTGEMAPVAVDKAEEGDTTYPLPECKYTPPAGMEFDCWTMEEKDYKPGDSITLTGPVTVKAKWKDQAVDPDAPDQTVTFDPGEGSGTMEAVTVKKGQWYDLPECTFEAPEGKEFDCWSIDGVRQEESRILIEGDVTLTALWKDKEPEPEDPNKPWTITFDAGGGTGTMSPVTVPKAEGGATYTLPACAFTAPEGKTFQAWKFDGQEYAPGAVVTITGDTTITAVWKDAEVKPPKPTSWKITYNLNGGYMTGSGPTSYNLSDQAQTLNVPVPYKSGYTFLGWTYSGVSKPTKSVIIRANMTGDLTVVANWQMNPGAGGSNNTSQGYYISVSATAGGEIIIPWEYASQGATVSVQARPQPGYEVGSVTVVNSQGFEVGDLRDLGGGSYSFTMPGYRVNVSATFKLQSAAAGPISRPVMNYEDVRLGDWYYDSVEYVYNRGMMSGVSATQFGPNGQATRGAIWTALAAHAGFDINGGATWYERGQYWAVNRGITDGESPSGNITREQLVTMLWRYKGSPAVFGGDLWQFSDGYAVSPYAMDAMRWAVSTGLMGGANGRLNPQASTTRAEAATILARFCQS